VNAVPDPLLLRESGRAGNRTSRPQRRLLSYQNTANINLHVQLNKILLSLLQIIYCYIYGTVYFLISVTIEFMLCDLHKMARGHIGGPRIMWYDTVT
jgi:hypothetical protein